MKCKCGNFLYKIIRIPCCSECIENPAYDNENNHVYDIKIIEQKNLERDGVYHDGECRYGTAYGAGCYMFICNKCNKKENLPVSDSC